MSAPDRTRQPRGIPVGGQFAAGQRAEIDTILTQPGDPAAAEMQTHTLTVTCNVDEVLPRARKPRPVSRECEVTVTVPAVSGQDAPVALTLDLYGREPASQLRSWNGDLYVRDTTDGSVPSRVTRGVMYSRFHSEDDLARAAQRAVDETLTVDGEIWVKTGEPRYVVMTFGLGNNHGGTSLSHTTHDNPNISPSSYFRADDFEAARAHAIEVATNRGDTESVTSIATMTPTIDVADPSVLRLVTPDPEPETVREARRDFDAARHAFARRSSDRRHEDATLTVEDDDAQEQAAWDALVKARADLSALTPHVTWAASEARPYEDR